MHVILYACTGGVHTCTYTCTCTHVAEWSENLQLKQEAMGSIPGGFSFSSSWLTNVDEMKGL